MTRGERVACCDLLDDRREAFAEEFGLTGYADATEMIQAAKPDLVHLAHEPDTRVELMTLMDGLSVPACMQTLHPAPDATAGQALFAKGARSRCWSVRRHRLGMVGSAGGEETSPPPEVTR